MLEGLRKWLNENQKMYLLYRRVRVLCIRLRYGLWGVHPTSLVIQPRFVSCDLQTGAYCSISHGAWIAPKVRLGNYVLLGPEVAIIGGDHVFNLPGTPITFSGRPAMPATVIEDDAWIGQRAIVKAGVRIGRGAIVAMGSVVTRDFEPFTIVAGVPARFLRRRFRSQGEEEIHDRMLAEPARPGQFCGPKQRLAR